ncbi:MAG: aspartyl protease family protein [Thermodesulfobacteriota bacterium]|nr:aspartyl protease family protein [Thermodesulfobacteriota bacterium]
MICPKCGFEQPDDIYCAFCGVNIEKYADHKKKKRFKGGLLGALVVIAAISVAFYVFSTRRTPTPGGMGEDGHRGGLAQIDQETGSQRSARQRAAIGRHSQEGTSRGPGSRSKRGRDRANGRRGQSGDDNDTTFASSSARDVTGGHGGEESEAAINTAREWLEKGRALDDDSDAEIECYERAVSLDPEFAPAYYRLGAIHYRHANYELADQQFANFVKYATEADWEAYDIYVYYSLADVDRLSGEAEEEAALEKGEEEPSGETEVETETEREAEAEKTGIEKASEETSGDVMTIVKFSAVNGHVMVPVVLNDSLQATVMVDTGAGITILSRELARDLGLTEQATHPITLKTIAKDVDGQLVTLDSIQIGDLRKDHFPVAITDLPLGEKGQFHGILGMDFMNNYIIQIDNERQSIALTPKGQ